MRVSRLEICLRYQWEKKISRNFTFLSTMYLPRRLTVFLSCYFSFCLFVCSAPAFSALPKVQTGNTNLSIIDSQTLNGSIGQELAHEANLSDSNTRLQSLSTNLTVGAGFWHITDTLSLRVEIGSWDFPPEKVLYLLEAAETTVGKKQATVLLDKTFSREKGSFFNTIVFEISPDKGYKRLTWGDVAEVLGTNGLPRFFLVSREWHNVYFDVIDLKRGDLGSGAVKRKWTIHGSVGGVDSNRVGIA